MAIEQPDSTEISIMVTSESSSNFLSPMGFESRCNTESEELKDLGIVAIHRPSNQSSINGATTTTTLMAQRKFIVDLFSSHHGSTITLNTPINVLRENHLENVQKIRNRQLGK
jgi:hypothetical protein